MYKYLFLLTAAICRLIPATPDLFPRDATGSYCREYQRVCSYYELCSRDEVSWDAIIEEKYEVRPPASPVGEETESEKESKVIT